MIYDNPKLHTHRVNLNYMRGGIPAYLLSYAIEEADNAFTICELLVVAAIGTIYQVIKFFFKNRLQISRRLSTQITEAGILQAKICDGRMRNALLHRHCESQCLFIYNLSFKIKKKSTFNIRISTVECEYLCNFGPGKLMQ